MTPSQFVISENVVVGALYLCYLCVYNHSFNTSFGIERWAMENKFKLNPIQYVVL